MPKLIQEDYNGLFYAEMNSRLYFIFFDLQS
jgi:hypothetical protein